MGVGTPGILARHIVPNVAGPALVYATLTVPGVIIAESFLSFLGLGVQEPQTSWGVLIADGAREMRSSPWQLIFPASMLALTLFALNVLGDRMRDAPGRSRSNQAQDPQNPGGALKPPTSCASRRVKSIVRWSW